MSLTFPSLRGRTPRVLQQAREGAANADKDAGGGKRHEESINEPEIIEKVGQPRRRLGAHCFNEDITCVSQLWSLNHARVFTIKVEPIPEKYLRMSLPRLQKCSEESRLSWFAPRPDWHTDAWSKSSLHIQEQKRHCWLRSAPWRVRTLFPWEWGSGVVTRARRRRFVIGNGDLKGEEPMKQRRA